MRAEDETRTLYAVYPGYVTSRYDGQEHFISARQLMDLYGVPHNQCVIVGQFTTYFPTNLIPLKPRYDGDYSVARVIQDMPWE